MPTYDYKCANGHQFECLQSITANPLAECVTCGAPVKRLIGGGLGVIFKGSGFYVTDSKAKSGSAKKKEGKGGTEKSASKGESGGSKSADKSSSGSDSGSSNSDKKPAKTN